MFFIYHCAVLSNQHILYTDTQTNQFLVLCNVELFCSITQKLHSVSDISLHDAAGVQVHFGPSG